MHGSWCGLGCAQANDLSCGLAYGPEPFFWPAACGKSNQDAPSSALSPFRAQAP